MVEEEIVNFGEHGSGCGILTSAQRKAPADNICIIFLNAGLIHKVGPNRIYKKLAVKYSEHGFASFRLDLSGLGDSGFSIEMSNGSGQIDEVKMAMNWLQENKGIDKFLLSGICSGAKVAWDVSLDDRRVIGLCLIDGIYTDGRLMRNVARKADLHLRVRYYKKHLFSWDRWLKLFSGKSRLLSLQNVAAGLRFITSLLKKKQVKQQVAIDTSDILAPWEILFERNVKIQMVFSEGSVAVDIYNLTLSKQLNHYRINGILATTFVKDVDHTFTPIWSQNYLSDLTTTWLKKEFEL
jgi:hypothetical protein